MGRHKTPIVGDGPVPTFAVELQALRAESGKPTYRQMAKKANFSHNGLSQADRGIRLPTWDCVRAYLKGCDVTAPEEIERWRQRWESTKKAFEMRERMVVPDVPRQRAAHPKPWRAASKVRENRRFDVDLDALHTMEHLVDALNDLIVGQGINIAALSRLITTRGDVTHRQSVLADAAVRAVLTGRRRPTAHLVAQIVIACGGNRADAIWWAAHWERIETNERNAQIVLDQLKEQVRLETIVVTSPAEDHLAVAKPVIDGEVTGMFSGPSAEPADEPQVGAASVRLGQADPSTPGGTTLGKNRRSTLLAAVIAGIIFAALIIYLA
jgi:hypothetical protein